MKSPSKCQYLSQQNEKKTKQNKTFEICKKPASIFKLMYICVCAYTCVYRRRQNIYSYTKNSEICLNVSIAMVLLVQQWLWTNRRSKKPVTTRLDVSAEL